MDNTDNKYILYGGPTYEQLHITESCQSLGELYMKKLTQHGKSVLLVNGNTGVKYTAAQLLKASISVAQGLVSANIGHGDVVGLCCENSLEFFAVICGTFFVGATLSPINFTYTDRELYHAMSLSKPKIMFATFVNMANVLRAVRQSQFMGQLVCIGGKPEQLPSKTVHFEDFIISENCATFKCLPLNVDETIALILYSSGTTGLPKGVMLSQGNIISILAKGILRPQVLESQLVPNPVVMNIGPWFHSMGIFVLLRLVFINRKEVFFSKFDGRTFLKCIQKYKVTTTFIAPPLIVFLAKSPMVDEYDVSSLKIVICGGATLSKELEEKVKHRIGLPIIRQGYGLTEGFVLTMQTDEHHKPGSVGVLTGGISGRIVDIKTGQAVGPYQRGELHFKGDTTMKGYIGNEAATAAIIDADGWLHTGDIGYVDDDGEYFIVDRLKELIKYKGFQVSPAEIESIILKHRDISDVGVVGLTDEETGEMPFAFVVKQPNSTITEQEIIDYVAGLSSPAKRLHGGVRFIDLLPKNPSGKLLRKELRKLLAKPQSKL